MTKFTEVQSMDVPLTDEKPKTVITGNFGDRYHYEVVGYLAEEPDTYSWFDVFVDGECINLGQVLADETDALMYFIEWVAKEIDEANLKDHIEYP